MQVFRRIGVVAAAVVVAGGCASGQFGTGSTSDYSPEKGYVMSESEMSLDCKQLTGRMQVRILEIRDYNERQRASGFSNFVQATVTGVIGGPKPGTPYAQEVARLQAYNAQLKAKGCQSFDLEAELQPKDVTATPEPTVKTSAASQR